MHKLKPTINAIIKLTTFNRTINYKAVVFLFYLKERHLLSENSE